MIPENATVLVRVPNWIGDAVMSTAAVEAIKSYRPDLKLVALAKPWVLEVIRNNPSFSDVLSYSPRHFPGRIRDFYSIVKSIRKNAFDACILMHNNFESAAMGYSAGIPVRIGWNHRRTNWFLSHNVDMAQDLQVSHQVYHYLAIANFVTGHEVNGFKPVLYLTEEDRKTAENWIQKLPGGGPVIPIAAGAAYGSAKCWPPEKFSQFVDSAINLWNARIVFLGGEKDKHIHSIIQSGLQEKIFSMVGEYSLSVQAAIIEKAGICIANDSGLIHVSAALNNVRIVAIFGPTVPAATKPFGTDHIVLHQKTDCWPCKHRKCPNGHVCMAAISADDVLAAVDTILNNR